MRCDVRHVSGRPVGTNSPSIRGVPLTGEEGDSRPPKRHSTVRSKIRPMIAFRIAAVLCLVVGASLPATAECAAGPSPSEAKRHTPFVFEGTVTRLGVASGHSEAVIETHRVWKGTVKALVSVHFDPNLDGPSFTVGNRYVIFAISESDTRRRVGFPLTIHEGTIWVNPCSGPIPVSPKLIEELGRSKPRHIPGQRR
jgi:hypothetical protein